MRCKNGTIMRLLGELQQGARRQATYSRLLLTYFRACKFSIGQVCIFSYSIFWIKVHFTIIDGNASQRFVWHIPRLSYGFTQKSEDD